MSLKATTEQMQCVFWKNMEYLRKKRKYSQEKMAWELNITRSRLSAWEQNRATPQLMTLVRVSLYFEVSMIDIVTKDLEKEAQEKSFSKLKITA